MDEGGPLPPPPPPPILPSGPGQSRKKKETGKQRGQQNPRKPYPRYNKGGGKPVQQQAGDQRCPITQGHFPNQHQNRSWSSVAGSHEVEKAPVPQSNIMNRSSALIREALPFQVNTVNIQNAASASGSNTREAPSSQVNPNILQSPASYVSSHTTGGAPTPQVNQHLQQTNAYPYYQQTGAAIHPLYINQQQVGVKRILAAVAAPLYTCKNLIPLITLGERQPWVPSAFNISRATNMTDWQGVRFEEIKAATRPGDIFEITAYQANTVCPEIDTWPPADICEAISANFQLQSEISSAMTMFVSSNSYIDPITKKETKLGSILEKQLGAPPREGLILDMAFVRFGHGSKILPKKLLYFPPDMTTPISMDHQKLCRYTVAATVSIEASNEQFSKLRMEEDNDYQIQRCGKIITTALLVNAGVNNDFKKQAKVQNAIITWKNEGEVTAMKAVIPDSADQFGSLGQAYSRGGLITIRNTETFPNKPCNMLIGEVNFDENEQSCIITARAPTSEVKKTLDPTGSGEITLSVVLTPAKDLIIGRDLANKMMKNELRMLHPGMPEAPKAIFKAVLGIPLEAVPQAKHTEPEIPEFLTDDQKSIIKATIIGEAPIIPVEAIAGSGKSTTLCWTVKLYRKAHPKLVAVITSTGNAPVLHVAEYFQDEIENPPLVLASLISTRKLDNENKERLKAFSLLSHIQYVLENCPISDPQKRSLQRALELEKAVEAEVKNPEADENDAMQNEGLFVEDLLPQVEEGDQENDDEPENAEEPQQEVREEATTLKKKKITRSGSIRKAIKIIIQYRPPCCIAGTTVMIMRIGAALRGVCKCLFVDEAATVYQLHLLNMLAEISSVEKLVLVGDTKQLTVYSRGIHKAVKKMGFESALEVLQDLHCSGIEKMALTTCFRSHPQLLDMIQATCYPEYELTTPVSPEEREGMKRIFGVTMPFFFLNVEGDDEQHYPVSRKNMHQHAALLQILTRLRKEGTVAVISLYAGQKHITFASVKDDKDVVAATVDSYQGSEADFVVVMTTKTTNAMKNEFVNNEQRKTVAITRARKGLIIIGNQKALINSTAWGPLIDYISQHQMIFQEIPQPTSRTLVIDGMPGLSIDSPPTLPYTEPQQQANEQPMEH